MGTEGLVFACPSTNLQSCPGCHLGGWRILESTSITRPTQTNTVISYLGTSSQQKPKTGLQGSLSTRCLDSQ